MFESEYLQREGDQEAATSVMPGYSFVLTSLLISESTLLAVLYCMIKIIKLISALSLRPSTLTLTWWHSSGTYPA